MLLSLSLSRVQPREGSSRVTDRLLRNWSSCSSKATNTCKNIGYKRRKPVKQEKRRVGQGSRRAWEQEQCTAKLQLPDSWLS